MTETMHGHVTALTKQGDGDQLAADATVGATTLQVLDVADFNEDGGQLRLGEVVYDYLSIDDETSTITIAAPGLTVAAVTDDLVEVFDLEAETPVIEFVATVVDDTNDDVIQAVVEHGLADRMADNIRGLLGESVVCEEDGDGIWVLTRVLGRSPSIDAEYVTVPGPGGSVPLPSTLDDIYAQADAIAEAAQEAANIGTAAQTTANGKNTVTYSADPPGATPNVEGDVWFQRTTTPESPTRPVIIAQYEGQGGTAWESVELSGLVIAYIDAGIITAGSAFVNALQVLTNFTLGDEDQDGVIQSYGFADPETTEGVLIHKGGIVAKGGYLAAPEIVGGTVTGAVFLTDGFYTTDYGVRIDESGIYAKGGTFVGSSFSGSFNTDAGSGSRQGSFDWTGLTFVNASFPTGTIEINSNGTIYARGSITSEAGVVAGGLRVLSPTTTASVANAVYDSAGNLLKSTSSKRFKDDVQPLELDPDIVLALEPKTYDSLVDDTDDRFVGFIAEDAEQLGLEQWVSRDADGQVEGFAYAAWTVAQQVVLRDQQHRIQQLEDTVAALADRLAALEGNPHG